MNENFNITNENLPESYLINLKNEWRILAKILSRPIISIPLAVCIASIYFANTIYIQPFSLVLNIAAAILAGFASAGIWNAIKNMAGNTILVKKGSSAVRNLSLARRKIKNISERTNMKASTEETTNLLSLLEKDIANSIQEWNDIFPGVIKIEANYSLLAEKEHELNIIEREKEELNKQLSKEKELKAEDKEKLDKLVKKILQLSQEINKLKSKVIEPISLAEILGSRQYPSLLPKCLSDYEPAPTERVLTKPAPTEPLTEPVITEPVPIQPASTEPVSGKPASPLYPTRCKKCGKIFFPKSPLATLCDNCQGN